MPALFPNRLYNFRVSCEVIPPRHIGRGPFQAQRVSFAAKHRDRLQCQSLEGARLVLTIRLSRIGKKKKPYYRVVVIERTRPRDGRIREAVGTYDPLKKPAEIKLDAERIKHWIALGAQPSDTVRSFLRQQKIA
ncbi:MAG: 30S ribosomal protein S16 [Acidobacteria bacterium]|nr:MAG: 30S ribosomal protein S16 [Acidobacteriota bacterium]